MISYVEDKKDNHNPKYSIVTPMYNSFSLMNRYFDSLEKQTYKNFEVIIVDDSSTDDSLKLLCEYVKTSTLNIKICQTDINSGPGNARNIGMDVATGEWLTFIDNDDWVDTQLLEKIDIVQKQHDANSIIFDYFTTNGKKNRISRSLYYGSGGEVSISDCIKYVRNHTFGKFYKLSKCREKNVKYPSLRRCEDVAFVIRAIVACESAYYLNEPLYYYYQRPTSLSNNAKLDETDMVKAFHVLEMELKESYPNELKEKSVTDILYGGLLMMCKARKSKKVIIEYIRNYEEIYPDWEKCEIITHINKSKVIFLKLVEKKNVLGMMLFSLAHTVAIGRIVK